VATRKRLSPHFTVEEFDCKDGTKVPAADYAGLTWIAQNYLEPLRAKYGPVKINSGFRTASYNAKIGGASKSYHIYTLRTGNNQACDITCSKGGPRDWHRTLSAYRQSKRGGRGGLGLYDRFVHVDTRPTKADWKG